MVGLTLGTGVGGVIAIDGRVHQGHDGTAGELGHQTIEPDGPPCGCGNRGCLEAFARADRIAAACGTATAEEAVARARAGDPRAVAGLARVGRYLGIGIANMVVVISPGSGRDRRRRRGGRRSAARRRSRAELRRRVFTTSLDEVEVVTAELGTWAGAIGAAIHGAEAALDAAAETAGRSRPARGGPWMSDGYQPQYRQIEQALRERIASLRPGRAPAVRRGAVRRVRRQPDDRPKRDAAAGGGRPDRARARARQLRRAATGPSPRQPPHDLHRGDAPGRPRPELAGADPGDPARRRSPRRRASASRRASRSSTSAACGWRTASRSRSSRPSSSARVPRP